MWVRLRQCQEPRHDIRPRTDRPQSAGCVGDSRSAHLHTVGTPRASCAQAEERYLRDSARPNDATITVIRPAIAPRCLWGSPREHRN